MKILVLHGPNLNALGRREPEIYGHETLHQLDERLRALTRELGVEIISFQSNSEGALIDALYVHAGEVAGIIINPAGLTTTSVSLRDALAAVGLPTIEVHLSNIHKREGWRQRSLIAPVALGQISGFGWRSYAAALRVLVETLRERGVQ